MRSKRDLVMAEQTDGEADRPQVTEFPWQLAAHLIPAEESLEPVSQVVTQAPSGRSRIFNHQPPPGTGRGRRS